MLSKRVLISNLATVLSSSLTNVLICESLESAERVRPKRVRRSRNFGTGFVSTWRMPVNKRTGIVKLSALFPNVGWHYHKNGCSYNVDTNLPWRNFYET